MVGDQVYLTRAGRRNGVAGFTICGTAQAVSSWGTRVRGRAGTTKKWPQFWGQVQEATDWWAMSGKAKQDAVPAARAAIRYATLNVEESEGHNESLRPLCYI